MGAQISGPRLPGCAPDPPVAGFPTLGLGGGRPTNQPSSNPRAVPLGLASGASLEARVAAEPMGAQAPQTFPRPSLGWRGVGAGSSPGSASVAPGPLVPDQRTAASSDFRAMGRATRRLHLTFLFP